jgi:flagellar hook-length control protein FliK
VDKNAVARNVGSRRAVGGHNRPAAGDRSRSAAVSPGLNGTDPPLDIDGAADLVTVPPTNTPRARHTDGDDTDATTLPISTMPNLTVVDGFDDAPDASTGAPGNPPHSPTEMAGDTAAMFLTGSDIGAPMPVLPAGNGPGSSPGNSIGSAPDTAAVTEASQSPVAATDHVVTGFAGSWDTGRSGTGDVGATSTAAPGGASDGTIAAPVVSADSLKDWLAVPLAGLVASSRREMAVRLHPPDLGELTVRVAVNGHDVSAWFETPQPQVQQIITDAIAQLQNDLGTAGYNLTGAWIGTGSSGRDTPERAAPLRVASGRALASGGLASGSTARGGTAIPSGSGVSIYV